VPDVVPEAADGEVDFRGADFGLAGAQVGGEGEVGGIRVLVEEHGVVWVGVAIGTAFYPTAPRRATRLSSAAARTAMPKSDSTVRDFQILVRSGSADIAENHAR